MNRRTLIGLSQARLSRRARELLSNGTLSENYVHRFEEGEFREPSGKKLQAIETALAEFEESHRALRAAVDGQKIAQDASS